VLFFLTRLAPSRTDERSLPSFLAYDFTRQPRKSWFVLDASAAAPTPSAPGSPSVPVHAQAITLDDQPLSDMTSSRGAVDPRASSALGSYLDRTTTPSHSVEGQSFELEQNANGRRPDTAGSRMREPRSEQ
jgi:hypothetical protein